MANELELLATTEGVANAFPVDERKWNNHLIWYFGPGGIAVNNPMPTWESENFFGRLGGTSEYFRVDASEPSIRTDAVSISGPGIGEEEIRKLADRLHGADQAYAFKVSLGPKPGMPLTLAFSEQHPGDNYQLVRKVRLEVIEANIPTDNND